MRQCSVFLVIAFLSFCPGIYSQLSPPSADQIMKEAMEKAALEKKNILVLFHASWCGWCHKMDSSIYDNTCKNFFEKNYVIRHLVVLESPGKKNLENPGAMELMIKYGGGEGLPFWLIFDKDGNLLADSQLRPEGAGLETRGESIGCPAAEKEVDFFIQVLKKTSHIDVDEQAAVQKRFRENEH